jgi:hypothetical protein
MAQNIAGAQRKSRTSENTLTKHYHVVLSGRIHLKYLVVSVKECRAASFRNLRRGLQGLLRSLWGRWVFHEQLRSHTYLLSAANSRV